MDVFSVQPNLKLNNFNINTEFYYNLQFMELYLYFHIKALKKENKKTNV